MAENNERAAKGGGSASSIPLPQTQQGVGQDAYRIQYSRAGGYSPGIVQNNGADWFGPLDPMRPVAPPEVTGRQLDFPSGYNLEITPRPYDPVKFPEMRALADAYDVLRLVIETRKDQMEKLTWSIKVRNDAQGKPAMDPGDAGLIAADQEITDFFQRPDGDHEWTTWLRSLLEDLFVIDAPAVYCHQTRGGKLIALEQVDGATVKRVINDWGRTPMPPAPAFQQILKGFPAINYTRDQLLYMPRNVRVHKFYGYSPVEQVIMTVNIALRRQLFMLQYYTEGNIPEALVGTPDLWTPKQIGDFQNAFDGMLAGNLAYRRRIKFVPGGVAKTFVQTKEAELTGKMEEWLARVVCYCFSISPQPFVSMMNRATAESAHDAALEEGLAPVQNWVKRFVDRVILMFWPQWAKYLEFSWDDDREVDQKIQSEILTAYVDGGLMKVNEAREVIGLDPDPAGDVLRVKTATGMIKLDVNDDAPTAGEVHEAGRANQQAQLEAKTKLAEQGKNPDGTPADGEDPNATDKGDGEGPKSGTKGPKSGTADEGKDGEDGGAAEKAAATFLRKRAYWGSRTRKGHRH
jgi:hypothetical protein